jgi:hypothetical protein
VKKNNLYTVLCACALIFCAAALYAKPAAVVLEVDGKSAAVVKYKGKKDVPLTLYMQLEPGASIVVKKPVNIRLTFLATDSIAIIKKSGTYQISASGKLVPDKKTPVTVANMDFESTINKYGKIGGTRGGAEDCEESENCQLCADCDPAAKCEPCKACDLCKKCAELDPKIDEVWNKEGLDEYAKRLLVYSIYLDAGCNEQAATEAENIQLMKEKQKAKK